MVYVYIPPFTFRSQKVKKKTYLERPMIYAHSTDKELTHAIEYAGQFCYAWRRHDWPTDEEVHTSSWVTPDDIGYSTRKNPDLLKRLKKMASDGVIEMRYYGRRPRFRGKSHLSTIVQTAFDGHH